MASELNFYKGLDSSLTVPSILIHDGKPLPIGKYLRDRTHDKMGVIFESGQKAKEWSAEVRSLLLRNATHASLKNAWTPSMALQMLSAQKVLDADRRIQLFNREEVL